MGIFKDYLEQVVNGIKNGDKIIEAMITASHIKNGTIEPEALAEILRRKDICKVCEYNSTNARVESEYVSALPDPHCVLCKCTLQGDDSKEVCLSCNCGMDAWNKRNPDLPQMTPKWTAFKIEDKIDDIKI